MNEMKRPLNHLFVLTIFLLFSACEGEYSPKPRGYFNILFPKKSYSYFQGDCDFGFDIPAYASVEPYSAKTDEKCWYNINYKAYRATLHLSYVPINKQGELKGHIENARLLAYKHTVKADAIEEIPLNFQSRKVFGLLYQLRGNSASQIQFYLTDSTTGFLRGALYFNASPNADSLKPVVDYLAEDINRMIASFQWHQLK